MNSPILPNNPVKRFDFSNLFKKISFWVAGVVSSAGAFLAWYLVQPEAVQNSLPPWLVTYASLIVMLNVVGVPLATSFKQKNLS